MGETGKVSDRTYKGRGAKTGEAGTRNQTQGDSDRAPCFRDQTGGLCGRSPGAGVETTQDGLEGQAGNGKSLKNLTESSTRVTCVL